MRVWYRMAAVGLVFALGACGTEQTLTREASAADQKCAAKGIMPGKRNTPTYNADQMNYVDCFGVERARIRAADEASECTARGLKAGTAEMAQCVAAGEKTRNSQSLADYKGYAAQMGR